MNKPYSEYPLKWKNYLILYCFSHIKSDGGLSIREFCRKKKINQATAKAWLTPKARSWLINEMISLKVEHALNIELEDQQLRELEILQLENEKLRKKNRQLKKWLSV